MLPLAPASPDVLTAHLDDEAVLLHAGTKRYFRLNTTGAWIWRGVEAGLDAEALVAHVCARFEVDEPTARTEIARVLGELAERELLARS